MKKIILVRHGETMWNIEGRTQGKKDSDLTKRGLNQALKLGLRLKKEDVDTIYTSPLNRAKSTAEIIGKSLGKTPLHDEGLMELGYGEWEGLNAKEIEAGYPEILKAWHTSPHNAIVPKGETLGLGQERITLAVNKIIEDNKGKNILIVSHGSIIKLYLLGFLNMSLADYYRLGIDNCSINIIELRQRGPVLVKYNDLSYMDIMLEGEENDEK